MARKRTHSLSPHARVISATKAAKNFGRLIERVREERADYIVEKAGTPVVRISPATSARCSVADLVELLRRHGPPDPEFAKAVRKGIAELNKPSIPEDRWER